MFRKYHYDQSEAGQTNSGTEWSFIAAAVTVA